MLGHERGTHGLDPAGEPFRRRRSDRRGCAGRLDARVRVLDLLAWAIFRFHRTSRDIELRRYHTDWRAVLIVSAVFLILGIATTFWLFLG